jgi:hypothetical protein
LRIVRAGLGDDLEAAIALVHRRDLVRRMQFRKRDRAEHTAAGRDDAERFDRHRPVVVDRIEAQSAIDARGQRQSVEERGHAARDRQPGGVGLAVARAKIIVDLHAARGRRSEPRLEREERAMRLCFRQKRNDDDGADERSGEQGREREELHAGRAVSGKRAQRDKVLSPKSPMARAAPAPRVLIRSGTLKQAKEISIHGFLASELKLD